MEASLTSSSREVLAVLCLAVEGKWLTNFISVLYAILLNNDAFIFYRYLKEKNPAIKTVLADPYGSVFHEFHNKGIAGTPSQKWEVEGAGKESIPGKPLITIIAYYRFCLHIFTSSDIIFLVSRGNMLIIIIIIIIRMH